MDKLGVVPETECVQKMHGRHYIQTRILKSSGSAGIVDAVQSSDLEDRYELMVSRHHSKRDFCSLKQPYPHIDSNNSSFVNVSGLTSFSIFF